MKKSVFGLIPKATDLRFLYLGFRVLFILLFMIAITEGCKEKVDEVLTDDSKVTYTGSYSSEVTKLLLMSRPWKTSTSEDGYDNQFPTTFPQNCLRDNYVQGAIQAAYTTEYYYRLGKTEQAEEFAHYVKQLLDYANSLCGSSSTSCNDCSCSTKAIWSCNDATSGPPSNGTNPPTGPTNPTTPTNGTFNFTLDGKKLDLKRAMLERGYDTFAVRLVGINWSTGNSSLKYDYVYIAFDKSQNPSNNFTTTGIPIADGATLTMEPSNAPKSYPSRVMTGLEIVNTQNNKGKIWYSLPLGTTQQLPGKYTLKRTGNTYEITVEVNLASDIPNTPNIILKGTYKGPMEII